MSLKAYRRKSRKLTVRIETNNTGKKGDFKKFFNKYNRRQAKKEILNFLSLQNENNKK